MKIQLTDANVKLLTSHRKSTLQYVQNVCSLLLLIKCLFTLNKYFHKQRIPFTNYPTAGNDNQNVQAQHRHPERLRRVESLSKGHLRCSLSPSYTIGRSLCPLCLGNTVLLPLLAVLEQLAQSKLGHD